jgi:hypothetical protein
MTRGFITLATGHIKYYKMALGLLKSFRLHNPEMKIAILCDKENEITAQFDDVIVLKQAYRDYRDKFSLLMNTPYDETIFIEPDCLIYRNLDYFWDLLSCEYDFTCFGWNDGGIDCWFRTEETKNRIYELMPELKDNDDIPLFNPGYFFIRKGEKCEKMYDDCIRCAQLILDDSILKNDPYITCRGNLRDDPIFDIGMAVNGFLCSAKPSVGKCMFLPSKYRIDRIDVIKGRLDVTDVNGRSFTDCALLHFSSRKVEEEGLYLWQSHILSLVYKNRKSILARLINNRFCWGIYWVFRRVKTKLKSLISK